MKSGVIHRKTKKNTLAMMAWAILAFVLYLWYMSTAYVYLINAYANGKPLDIGKMLSATTVLTIKPQEEAFPTSQYNVTTPPFLQLSELYMDGARYRFKVEIQTYEEVGLGYGLAQDKSLKLYYNSPKSKLVSPDAIQKVAFVTIGGERFVALLPRDASVQAGDVVSRVVFSQLPWYLGHDLGLTDYAGIETRNYICDLRGIVVEDETTDFALIFVFSILFPAFLAYAILCLINPNFHPNYLRIAKFGDVETVCKEIDAEYDDPSNTREKRKLYTKHYIIEQTLYSTKVMKNHKLRN